MPLDLSLGDTRLDRSGAPIALVELARQRGDLVVIDDLAEQNILVEFPFGEIWRDQTGCRRFVRLRTQAGSASYALVR